MRVREEEQEQEQEREREEEGGSSGNIKKDHAAKPNGAEPQISDWRKDGREDRKTNKHTTRPMRQTTGHARKR